MVAGPFLLELIGSVVAAGSVLFLGYTVDHFWRQVLEISESDILYSDCPPVLSMRDKLLKSKTMDVLISILALLTETSDI